MNGGLLLALGGALAAVLAGSAVLPAVGGLMGAYRLASVGWRVASVMGSGRFTPVEGAGGDVLKLDLWWRPLPVVFLPLSAALVRERDGWVLVDAGAGNSWSQAYATKLVQAVQKAVKAEGLKAVLLTHAHADHVGALPALQQAFPGTPIVLHADEAPFLLGREQYVPPGSAVLAALRAAGLAATPSVQLREVDLTLLRGSTGGDLRQHGIHSLSWVPTFGHSPGHVSYLHQPSGTLLAGDAVFNVLPSVSWASGIEALVTRPLGWFAGPAARLALRPGRALLGGLLGRGGGGDGGLPGAAVDAAMGALGSERLTSSVIALVTGAGNQLSSGILQAGKGVGQELGTFKLVRLLPGLTVRISPSFLCTRPRCDVEQGARSICRLADLQGWQRLLPSHDTTGRGLTPADMRAFCKVLPASAKG